MRNRTAAAEVSEGISGQEFPAAALIAENKVLRAANRDLWIKAYTDYSLTGLYNRLFLEESLLEKIINLRKVGGKTRKRKKNGKTIETHKGFILLFVDMDGLKEINDIHGHEAGDTALRLFSKRLRKALRDTDIAARVGGDEFAILLDSATLEDFGGLDNLVAELSRRESFMYRGIRCAFGASIGAEEITLSQVLECTNPAAFIKRRIRAADKKMYQAKEERKFFAKYFPNGLGDPVI